MAIAYAKDGIRVNAVAPGWIDTPLLEPLKETFGAGTLARTPFNRYGEPSEIGQVVAFFASPAASFITGTITRRRRLLSFITRFVLVGEPPVSVMFRRLIMKSCMKMRLFFS